jgi:esterase/lipase superfamily enzyme
VRSLYLVTTLILLMLSGCDKPPDLVGIDSLVMPAESVPNVSRHRIFIATTRQATEAVGAFFSSERAPELGFASVVVTVPPTHEVGKLERPIRLPPHPSTEFAVVDPVVFRTDASFVADINRELAKRPKIDRKLLFFVHGYNSTTSDAILRLAQFVEDSGYTGVPVLFTWASAAKLPRYVYDLNSALVARGKIQELAAVLRETNATSIDVFAHSMGAFLTMEGLVEAEQKGRLGKDNLIDHVILASPDIDQDLFKIQLAQLPAWLVSKIYVLISKDDSALNFSRRIAGGVPRVGAANAADLDALGVTVIDLSEIDDSSAGSHTKFAGSPEVVQLIGAGLKSGGRLSTSPSLAEFLRQVPITILGN